MDIQFRAAKPEDVEEACLLIYSAAVEAFDYVFATTWNRALDFLRFTFRRRGLFGYNNHVVVIVESKVVGIGAFYSGFEFNRLNWENIVQIFRFFGPIRAWGVLRKGYLTQRLIPPPKRYMEYIADLGIHPEMRGKGIGTALLLHQMKIAHHRGKKLYALDVAANNPKAQRLYERLGFKVVQERGTSVDSAVGLVPAIRRMEMKLESTSSLGISLSEVRDKQLEVGRNDVSTL
ncbi:MAG: GNAT family N-acetyltransferase [Deltaproteobacteria bacterium]|nr:GNAT family N-acetyltransferase [Deltaproteobacteria bacterium]